jgi:hypothetical protein
VAVALTWPYLSASPITIAFGQPHASRVSRLLLVRHPIPGRVGEPSPICLILVNETVQNLGVLGIRHDVSGERHEVAGHGRVDRRKRRWSSCTRSVPAAARSWFHPPRSG